LPANLLKTFRNCEVTKSPSLIANNLLVLKRPQAAAEETPQPKSTNGQTLTLSQLEEEPSIQVRDDEQLNEIGHKSQADDHSIRSNKIKERKAKKASKKKTKSILKKNRKLKEMKKMKKFNKSGCRNEVECTQGRKKKRLVDRKLNKINKKRVKSTKKYLIKNQKPKSKRHHHHD
jgi:hypothetical protein